VNKDEVLKYLKEAAETTESLKKIGAPGEEHTVWILTTKDLLKEIFGENSDFYKHFSGITYEYAGDSRFDRRRRLTRKGLVRQKEFFVAQSHTSSDLDRQRRSRISSHREVILLRRGGARQRLSV
jgi:hypothetical protein